MVSIKTPSGFTCELDEGAFDDMELLDGLVELDKGNAAAFPAVADKLLGPSKKALYDHLRDENGRVSIKAALVEINAIINAVKDGKK